MSWLKLAEEIGEALAPPVQRGIVRFVQNLETHPDPEAAIELAVLCTTSKTSSVAIINAALKLAFKTRKTK